MKKKRWIVVIRISNELEDPDFLVLQDETTGSAILFQSESEAEGYASQETNFLFYTIEVEV